MKLDKAHIKFIDTYLENSDVRHLDIRLEMVDHVATAIEKEIEEGDQRAFIKVFKDYMLKNKSTLIENKHQYLKSVMLKNLKLIFKFCISLKGFLVSAGIFSLLYISFKTYGVAAVKDVMSYVALGLFVFPVLSYYVVTVLLKLQKISSVERLGIINLVFCYMIHFLNLSTRNHTEWTYSIETISLFITAILTFGIAFSVVAFQIVRKGAAAHKKMQLS